MRPRKYPKGNMNEKPTNPRPSTSPPAQKAEYHLTDYTRGYIKGFADAIKQYGIDTANATSAGLLSEGDWIYVWRLGTKPCNSEGRGGK